MRLAGLILLTAMAAGVAPAAAQTADERAAARDVVKKRGDAVVMVLATIKLRVNIGGRGTADRSGDAGQRDDSRQDGSDGVVAVVAPAR